MLKKTSLFMVLVFLVIFSGVVSADSLFLGPDSFQHYEDWSGGWKDVRRSLTDLRPIDYYTTSIIFLWAPIQLPEGAKITSMVVFHYDNNNHSKIKVEIVRFNRYGNSWQTIIPEWISTDSTTDPKITKRKNVDWAYNKILNGSCTYHVKLKFVISDTTDGWTDLRLYGVKIFYKPPTS